MEKATATHSSTLAWKLPRTEEPGRLQSMGLRRGGHDWTTSLSLSRTGEGNGDPRQCPCLENPRDGGAWWAASVGSHSQTRLKQLSSSSIIMKNKGVFIVSLTTPAFTSPESYSFFTQLLQRGQILNILYLLYILWKQRNNTKKLGD